MHKLRGPFSTLFTYWLSMPRLAGDIPLKSDVNLSHIPELAPNLLIGEWATQNEMVIRYAGKELEKITGVVMVGQNLFDFYPREEAVFHTDFLDKCCQQPCAGYFVRPIISRDKLVHDMEMAVFPLASSTGMPRYILGLGHSLPNPAKSYEVYAGSKRSWRLGHVSDADLIDLGFGAPEMRAVLLENAARNRYH